MTSSASDIVVTGANGLVGRRICETLLLAGATVRAVVRRAGTAPGLTGEAPESAGILELVGDFTDPDFAATAVSGARSVITTVHPMGSDRATQHRVGVQGTSDLARAAADAGVERFVHMSTAAVYDRRPGVGDVDEGSVLVGDDAGDYAVTKRDADRALAEVGGITTVLLRPPRIFGPGPSSVWNTLTPAEMRDDEDARRAVPEATLAWVHVSDLATLAADLAEGRVPDAARPDDGPVSGQCVALNVAAACATERDYVGAVTGALGVDPIWERAPAWTGRFLAGRAHAWGWTPAVDIAAALAELVDGL